MDINQFQKYARLIVKTGINLQKGQTLVITCPIECAEFVRTIAEVAYSEGARDVVVSWRDELSSKIRYLHAPSEIFDEFPNWQKELYVSYAKAGAGFLSIYASDPELLKDVDPDRLTRAQKASNTALEEYRERLMSNMNPWCVISVPTIPWAKKVFPNLSDEEAVERLWQAILTTVRVDTPDPVAAWDEHKADLKRSNDFLDKANLKSIRLTNSLGTDLTIELPKGHLWLAGSDKTQDGVEFIANMPTEEVFTVPRRTGVNGKVVSSKPLPYNGNLIDNFSLTFKDGKIVDFSAEKGYEVLKNLVETDEGSHYLGEVALVPYDSPISKSGILFYNTLFDENASCHLAIGKAYPVCLTGGDEMSKEALIAAGVNDSLVHEDFMIGTRDLNIIGTTVDGEEIKIFENGSFAFEY